jgi:hypothetical protein
MKLPVPSLWAAAGTDKGDETTIVISRTGVNSMDFLARQGAMISRCLNLGDAYGASDGGEAAKELFVAREKHTKMINPAVR